MVLDSDEEINAPTLMEDAYLDDADIDDEEDNQSPTYTFKVANGRIRGMTDELDAMQQAVDKHDDLETPYKYSISALKSNGKWTVYIKEEPFGKEKSYRED